ncbi:MAG: hypothetical protein Q9221_000076 [Calogaya cf. arnoldii]
MNGAINHSAIFDQRDSAHTYYDAVSDHREGQASWNPHYHVASPTQNRDPASFVGYYQDPRTSPTAYHSPMSSHFPQHSPTMPTSHAHPPSRHNSISQSPRQPLADSPIHRRNSSYLTDPNGAPAHPAREHSYSFGSRHENQTRTQEDHKASNPMSFSNILSSNAPEVISSTPAALPPLKQFRKAPSTPNGDTGPPSAAFRRSSHKSVPAINEHREPPKPLKADLSHPPAVKTPKSKAKVGPSVSDKENKRIDKEIARINAMELSDIESLDWAPAKQDFVRQSNKRLMGVQQAEDNKRKRRRTASTRKYSEPVSAHAEGGRQRFRDRNKEAAESEVRKKEQQDEKERKKDMQRKRRREKTVQQAMQNHQENLLKAEATNDSTEKERLLREAQKAERKAKNTQKILEHGDLPGEIREVTPLAPNLEGGTMSTFQTGNDISPEPPRKKQKGPSIRPKKSKEKKQAEKDAAEAAYAAMEQDNLVLIAPKEETRRGQLIRETKEAKQSKEASPAVSAPVLTNYASKGYAQIYEQIWKDISRKDAPKVYRIKDNSLSTKQSNLRKTAQLASKEARRWQLRTNKGMKDVQARAKRSMREMMSFWKRNEREERDMRRAAERQELENAKKAEADREANRQKRKLNFLISQTELYSHFIGRKIKTDQVERSTDTAEVAVSGTTIQPGGPGAHTIDLPNSVAKVGAKVTNFEDLDFDAEDESVLQQAAMANAQNAVQEAQDKARAFNGEDNDLQNRFDEGEMNFQNPTSMGEENVTQPKMLNAQLKEYQLKGDKIEEDVYCDLTYRQRAYYGNLRSRISIMDLIEKAALGDDQDTATLMNLVMQFRKVCNHPDLFERADTSSPLSMAYYAECASFVREGHNVNLVYSSRNLIEYNLPRLLNTPEARLDIAGPGNDRAGWRDNYLGHCMNIWKPEYIQKKSSGNEAFSWLRFADISAGEVYHASRRGLAERAINLDGTATRLARLRAIYDNGGDQAYTPAHALFRIVDRNDRQPLAALTDEHRLYNLLNISRNMFEEQGLNLLEPCARPAASAPPIEVCCSNQGARVEKENTIFNAPLRRALYGLSERDEAALIESKANPRLYPEEVQRVVIAGGGGAGVDFNTRSKENRSKDIVHWLADDDQADIIEQKEKEMAEKGEESKKGKKKTGGRKKDVSMDDLYHEGEGHFGDDSNKPSGAATPIDAPEPPAGKRKGISKKAKTTKQRLAIIDGGGD